jgi:hypothetical protein
MNRLAATLVDLLTTLRGTVVGNPGWTGRIALA